MGKVASSVTGLHPWVGYKLTERVTLWGVTGYGRGSLSLTPGEALSLPMSSLTSPISLNGGLSMSMLAGGVRGDLVDSGVGGFGLAFKADALWVGTGSEAVDGPAGRLAATEAVVDACADGAQGLEGLRVRTWDRATAQPGAWTQARRWGCGDGARARTSPAACSQRIR